MKKKKPLTDEAGEVRELTAEDFRAMKPLDQYPELAKLVRGRGERGPQKAPTKQQVTLRLDREVVERFRATGPGWQGRINEVLKKAKPG
jgi:uncharacterized protein (DUF4415 family)